MIKLKPNKTTGKQAHKVVMTAIKKASKRDKVKLGKSDFCRDSGLSRVQLHRYKENESPGIIGLYKIAAGLIAWGFEAEVVIDA